jgi:hypothetical protein
LFFEFWRACDIGAHTEPRRDCLVNVTATLVRPVMEGALNTPNNQNDNSKDAARSVTNWLHPRVYAVLIGLTLWFVLGSWSFAGAGVTDYLLAIVSGFILVVVALTLILSRVGNNETATDTDEAKAGDALESFYDWAASGFEAYDGQLSGFQAATLILLPIAAAAIGMTAFGIEFLIIEHGGI